MGPGPWLIWVPFTCTLSVYDVGKNPGKNILGPCYARAGSQLEQYIIWFQYSRPNYASCTWRLSDVKDWRNGLIVYRMDFDKTKWSCPWNSDQNCTQNYARGGGVGVVGSGVVRVRCGAGQEWWGQGGRGCGQAGRGGVKGVGVVGVRGGGVVGVRGWWRSGVVGV